MKSRIAVPSALLLLAVSALAVRLGKPHEEQSLEAVAALWGDVIWDTSRVASSPLHVSEADEARLGSRLAQTVATQTRPDLVSQPRVSMVGMRLAAASPGRLPYQFHAIDEGTVNAFALPGGHVYVTKGLDAFVHSDDELAAVMGHEMAHIELRHCLDGHRYATVFRRVGLADAGEIMDAMRRALAISYSREQEFNADARGAVMAAQAGYDATAAIRVFRRLALQEAPRGNDLLRPYFESHPGAEERAQRLEGQLRTR